MSTNCNHKNTPPAATRRRFLRGAVLALLPMPALAAHRSKRVRSRLPHPAVRPRTFTLQDERDAYEQGDMMRRTAPTRPELLRLVGPSCAANSAAAWSRAGHIETDYAFAALAALCLADPRLFERQGEMMNVAGAFAAGWSGRPFRTAKPGPAPAAEWSASEGNIRRLAEWLRDRKDLQLGVADDVVPYVMSHKNLRVICYRPGTTDLRDSLRWLWQDTELQELWQEMNDALTV